MELQAFYNIEPFGEYRNELRHGQRMALEYNLNRDAKTHPKPYETREFMNFIEEPEEKIYSVEELEAYADKLFGT